MYKITDSLGNNPAVKSLTEGKYTSVVAFWLPTDEVLWLSGFQVPLSYTMLDWTVNVLTVYPRRDRCVVDMLLNEAPQHLKNQTSQQYLDSTRVGGLGYEI